MSAHRRALMTATAAGAVLCALWFVPSANATPDAAGITSRDAVTSAPDRTDAARLPQGASSAAVPAVRPAGSEAYTGYGAPYILGGLGLAGTGGYLIVRARRRAAAGPAAQTSSPVAD